MYRISNGSVCNKLHYDHQSNKFVCISIARHPLVSLMVCQTILIGTTVPGNSTLNIFEFNYIVRY